MVKSAEDAESSASSSVCSPSGGAPYIGERRSTCVGRRPWPGRLLSWRWLPLCGPLAASALPEDSMHVAS